MVDSKPGLTLVELLIGFLIGSIIVMATWAIYLAVFRLFNGQKVAINAASQNRIALDEVINSTPQAYQVASSCQEIQCKVGGTGIAVYKSSNASSLVLQLWPLDSTGPIDCTPACNNADYITFYLEGTNLIKETAHDNSYTPVSTRTETKKIIATNIKSLTFEYQPSPPNTTEVKVTVTTEDRIWGFTAFNPYNITNSAKARILNRTSSGFSQYSFPYAILGANGGNIVETVNIVQGTTINNGTVYSNGDITCSTASTGTCTVVNGDIKANGLILGINPFVANEVKTCPTACQGNASFPISDTAGFLSYWKGEANRNNDAVGSLTITAPTTLGPKLINGDLTISSTLYVTGPIYVTGALDFSNNSQVNLQCGTNNTGTVIIADGRIRLRAGHGSIIGAGSPKNYFLIASYAYSGSFQAIEAEKMDSTYDAIFYALRDSVKLYGGVHPAGQIVNGALYGNNTYQSNNDVAVNAGTAGQSITINYPGNINPATFSTCQ